VITAVVIVVVAIMVVKLPLLPDQQSPGSDIKPLTQDREHDNVFVVQDCRTPRGAVIDECGATVG
jgi:hypothetical protein